MELRRKKVVVEYGGEKVEVVVRELTWGELNDAYDAATQTDNVGGVFRFKFNFSRLREEIMVRAIESAPFTVNRENVRKLPAVVAEEIWRAVQELNPLG